MNLIYYTIIKSRRVLLTVLVEETLALADACDTVIIIRHDLHNTVSKKMKINILTDIPSIFKFMIKNAPATEKLMVIYMKATIEAYNDYIIHSIVCVMMNLNFAGARKKSADNNGLVKAIESGTRYI